MASEADQAPKKSGGGMIGLLVVTLLAAGGGGGFGFFLNQQFQAAMGVKPKEEHKAAAAPEAHGAPVPGAGRMIEMSPMIGNLAEPKESWLRIEATILIEGMIEGSDRLAGQISEDITAYIKTLTMAQLEGPSGFQNLREDLLDRAKIRGGVHVKDLVIHGVVIE